MSGQSLSADFTGDEAALRPEIESILIENEKITLIFQADGVLLPPERQTVYWRSPDTCPGFVVLTTSRLIWVTAGGLSGSYSLPRLFKSFPWRIIHSWETFTLEHRPGFSINLDPENPAKFDAVRFANVFLLDPSVHEADFTHFYRSLASFILK